MEPDFNTNNQNQINQNTNFDEVPICGMKSDDMATNFGIPESAEDENLAIIEEEKKPLEERTFSKYLPVRKKSLNEIFTEVKKYKNFSEVEKYSELFIKSLDDKIPIIQEIALDIVIHIKEKYENLGEILSSVFSKILEKVFSSNKNNLKEKAKNFLLSVIETEENFLLFFDEIKSAIEKENVPRKQQNLINFLIIVVINFGVFFEVREIVGIFDGILKKGKNPPKKEISEFYKETYKYLRGSLKPYIARHADSFQQNLEKIFEDVDKRNPEIPLANKTIKHSIKNTKNGKKNNKKSMDIETQKIFESLEATEIFSNKFTEKWVESLFDEDKKWNHKVEILEEFVNFTNKKKIKNSNRYYLIQGFNKLMKDSHVNVISGVILCINNLALGLRRDFREAKDYFENFLEKFKIKKEKIFQDLLVTMENFLTFCFSLEDALPDIKKFMLKGNKAPIEKERICILLEKILIKTEPENLNKFSKELLEFLFMLSEDAASEVRNFAFQILGLVLAKIGKEPMTKFLKDIGEIKKKKIEEASEIAPLDEVIDAEMFELRNKNKKNVSNNPINNTTNVNTNVNTNNTTNVNSNVNSNNLAVKKPLLGKIKEKKADENLFLETEQVDEIENLNKEDIENLIEAKLTTEISGFLKDNNWELRKQGFNKMSELLNSQNDLFSNCMDHLMRFIKLRLKEYKENNVNILKEVFIFYENLIEKANQKFTKKHSFIIIKNFSEKIGDNKLKENISNLLYKIFDYQGPKFAVINLLKHFTNNVKAISSLKEFTIFIEKSIVDFSIERFPIKETIDFSCFLAGHTNQQIRLCATNLLCCIYKFLGDPLKTMLRDIKESTLNVILQEFKKIQIIPNSEKATKRNLKGVALLSEEEKNLEKNPNKILDSLIPRADISKKLQILLKEFDSNLQAKTKIEILGKIENLIEDSNSRIMPNGLGELFERLRNNINDANKTFVRKILKIYLKILESLGTQSKNFSKLIVKSVMGNLNDAQVHVREDAKSILQKWVELNGVDSLLKNANGFLLENKADLRFEILNLFFLNFGKFKDCGNFEDFSLIVEGIVNCLLDKNLKIKELAEKVCSEVMKYVRINVFEKVLLKFKPEISNSVRNIVEKYVGNFTGNFMKNNVCNKNSDNISANVNVNEIGKNEVGNSNNKSNDFLMKFDDNNIGKKAGNVVFDENFKLNFNKEIKIDLPNINNTNNNNNSNINNNSNQITNNVLTNFKNLKFDEKNEIENTNKNPENTNMNINSNNKNNNKNYNILTKSDIKKINQTPITQKVFKSEYSTLIFERKKRIDQDKKIQQNFPKNFLEDFYIYKAQEELKSIIANETLIPYMLSNDQIKFEVFFQKIISAFQEEKLQIFINLDLLLKILLAKILHKKNFDSDLYLRLSAEFLSAYYINKSECHLSEIEKKFINEIIFTIFSVRNFGFINLENEKRKLIEKNLACLIFEDFDFNSNSDLNICEIDFDAVLFLSKFLEKNFLVAGKFNSYINSDNVCKNLFGNKERLVKIFVDYLNLKFKFIVCGNKDKDRDSNKDSFINDNEITEVLLVDFTKFKLFSNFAFDEVTNNINININELKGLFELIKEIISINSDKKSVNAFKNLLNLIHFNYFEINKTKLEEYLVTNYPEISYLINNPITNELSKKTQKKNPENNLIITNPSKSQKANSIIKSINFFTEKLKEKNPNNKKVQNFKEKLNFIFSLEELVINKINIFDNEYSNIIINEIDKIFDSFFSIYFELLGQSICEEKTKIFFGVNNLFTKILLMENFPKNLKFSTIKNLYENFCEIISTSNLNNFEEKENLQKFVIPFLEKFFICNDYITSIKILFDFLSKKNLESENFLCEKISEILKKNFLLKLKEEIEFVKIEEIILSIISLVDFLSKKNFEENKIYKLSVEIICEIVILIKEQIWTFYEKAVENLNFSENRVKNFIKFYLRIENGINSEKNIDYVNNNVKDIKEIMSSLSKNNNNDLPLNYLNFKEEIKDNESDAFSYKSININNNILPDAKKLNETETEKLNEKDKYKDKEKEANSSLFNSINRSELFILNELKRLIKQFTGFNTDNNNDNNSENIKKNSTNILLKKKSALEILAFLRKEKIKFEMLGEYLSQNDIIFIKEISNEIKNSSEISKKNEVNFQSNFSNFSNSEIKKKDITNTGLNVTSDFGNLIAKGNKTDTNSIDINNNNSKSGSDLMNQITKFRKSLKKMNENPNDINNSFVNFDRENAQSNINSNNIPELTKMNEKILELGRKMGFANKNNNQN